MFDTSTHTGVPTVADLMADDEQRSKRQLVQIAAGVLIGIGLLFTAVLNFLLYSRAFDGTLRMLGAIPALLIEGSLAVFLLGNYVWFSHGTQGTLAKLFGWLMFAVVAANTVIEFNALTNPAALDGFLKLYAFWGVPVVIPLVIAFWKAVIDADPAIQIMRKRRKIQQTLQMAQWDSLMVALGSEESRAALTRFGQRGASDVNRRLSGGIVLESSSPAPAAVPPTPQEVASDPK